tara:strand:+ start:1026 stop:1238 length:213 start_codon:yes stop_codon:yes gene_type:complete
VTKNFEHKSRVTGLARVVVTRLPVGFSATTSEVQSDRPYTLNEKLPTDIPDIPPRAGTLKAVQYQYNWRI